MSTLNHIFAVSLLAVAPQFANANCAATRVSHFVDSTMKNKIKVFVNQTRTATLSLTCQPLATSREETLNDFAKLGELNRVSEDIYYVDRQAFGVFTRNYLRIDREISLLTLVTNSNRLGLASLQNDVVKALK